MLDLRIDGAAVDGATTLFALHNPSRRQRQLTCHAHHHRRIHGESHPQPMRRSCEIDLPFDSAKVTIMCGRYRLTAKERYLRDHFSLDEDPAWHPRWNIVPTQQVATIRQHLKEPRRIFGLMRWGLIPYWAKDQSFGVKTINAVSETSRETRLPRCAQTAPLSHSCGRLFRMVATRSCMCDCPASITRPDLPSHWQYPTRCGDSVTTRLEALGQCIPPSQDGHRNREGTIFLPASRRIGARVSGGVSRCEPL